MTTYSCVSPFFSQFLSIILSKKKSLYLILLGKISQLEHYCLLGKARKMFLSPYTHLCHLPVFVRPHQSIQDVDIHLITQTELPDFFKSSLILQR